MCTLYIMHPMYYAFWLFVMMALIVYCVRVMQKYLLNTEQKYSQLFGELNKKGTILRRNMKTFVNWTQRMLSVRDNRENIVNIAYC